MSGFSHWKDIADALEPACKDAVSDTAKAGKGHFQEQIRANGQVLTGRMLNSVYASTPNGSDYQGGEKMLPEEKPSHDKEAVIGVAVEYGIFNDMGTVHMAGRPIVAPAMDKTRVDLDKAMEGIVKKLKDAAR